MEEELTKSGKPVAQVTFGILVLKDKECRHAAVDLGFFDRMLSVYGRYLHYNGYRTLKEARKLLKQFATDGVDPFVALKPKTGQVVNFNEWKSKNT